MDQMRIWWFWLLSWGPPSSVDQAFVICTGWVLYAKVVIWAIDGIAVWIYESLIITILVREITGCYGEKRIISAWAGGQNRSPIRSTIECNAPGVSGLNYVTI